MLHTLIDAGADVDGLGGWYDGRPLQTAARDGMADCADILLARGAKRDIFTAVLVGDRALFEAELGRDPARATAPALRAAQSPCITSPSAASPSLSRSPWPSG